MHRCIRTLVPLAVAVSLSACQTTGTTTATRPDVQAEPAQEVSVADMAGSWAGRWSGGGARTTLTIVAADVPEIKYCFKDNCRTNADLENVRFVDGALKFKWGGRFTFELANETLKGRYVDQSGLHYTTRMSRKN